MPDVAERIREHLEEWTLPGVHWVPVMGLSAPTSPADFEAFWKKFASQGASAFDRMRNALLAVLDATDPDTLPPNGCGCVGCLREWVRQSIVEALGMVAP